jgi:HPr kinase/phosphorylase
MRRGKLPFIPVGEFYTRHADALQLKLVGPALGFERKIREPTINRPGLALSGFFTYFAGKRIQVLGNAEASYLKSLTEPEQQARCLQLCQQHIPSSSFPAISLFPRPSRMPRLSSKSPSFAPRW